MSEAVQLSFWQEGHPVNEGIRTPQPEQKKHPEKNNGSTQDASLTEGQRVVLQNGSFAADPAAQDDRPSGTVGQVERCYRYARQAVDGNILVCEKTRAACQRFFDDLERSKSPDCPWEFDPAKAARPGRFMEKFLVPTKGDYDELHMLDWQCFVECNLYGWVDKTTRLRRFREGLVIVGAGNGKSTLMAGNATFASCKDGERGADVYLLANSKEQAGIVFQECSKQIENSPQLARRFRPLRDGIYYDKTQSTIKHRSSDSKRLDGLNPYMAIFDEIHEYRDFKLLNIIKHKSVKRKQPLILYITTMGEVLDGPLMYYYDLFTDALYGRLDMKVADQMFAFICELDEHDDVADPRNWIKANPSLGLTLRMQDLQDEWARVKLIPSERANFICKQLNVMVNADDMAFVQPEVIRRNRGHLDPEKLLGRRCYGGFDLSNREDFTAAALEFPLEDGKTFVLLHSWVPRAKVEADNEKIDYYGLAMRGLLTIVDAEYIQQEDVFDWFVEQSKKYELDCIGYDPANATRLIQMLQGKGFDCKVVRQGPITLNDPMKDVKEMLLAGNIITNEDPMFTWYTDNVRISGERRHTDKENWMPMKRNRFRKIDGFMAFLDAHCVRMQREPAGVIYTPPKIRVVDLGGRRSAQRRAY